MEIDIKLVKSEEISLDRLVEIQRKSFDETYIKQCGDSLIEEFKGSSFLIALDGKIIVAYNQYQAPRNDCFEKYAENIRNLLEYRRCVFSGDKDLSELINFCSACSGLPVNSENHDIKMFPGDVSFDELNDVISVELAVPPKYRQKGIATNLRKELINRSGAQLFTLNRKNSAMYNIEKNLGARLLMQLGPIYEDGSSTVLSVNKGPK